MYCLVCGLTYTTGDTELRVEGEYANEVKELASHLLKPMNGENKKRKGPLLHNYPVISAIVSIVSLWIEKEMNLYSDELTELCENLVMKLKI